MQEPGGRNHHDHRGDDIDHHPACTHQHIFDDEPCRDLDDNELDDLDDAGPDHNRIPDDDRGSLHDDRPNHDRPADNGAVDYFDVHFRPDDDVNAPWYVYDHRTSKFIYDDDDREQYLRAAYDLLARHLNDRPGDHGPGDDGPAPDNFDAGWNFLRAIAKYVDLAYDGADFPDPFERTTVDAARRFLASDGD